MKWAHNEIILKVFRVFPFHAHMLLLSLRGSQLRHENEKCESFQFLQQLLESFVNKQKQKQKLKKNLLFTCCSEWTTAFPQRWKFTRFPVCVFFTDSFLRIMEINLVSRMFIILFGLVEREKAAEKERATATARPKPSSATSTTCLLVFSMR